MATVVRTAGGNSSAEDRFIELFCDAFGSDKGQYVCLQYPMVDIYGGHRTIDFAFSLPDGRVAIEVDGNTWHQPGKVSQEKYHDDLLKQNSMVFEGWRVYRWTSAQIEQSPERVKDELVTFLGQSPAFRPIEDSLPRSRAGSSSSWTIRRRRLRTLPGCGRRGKASRFSSKRPEPAKR